ncbi:MAG: hypothetical protein ACFFD1_09900 [Candidatus Thorarchaeota archaeon]
MKSLIKSLMILLFLLFLTTFIQCAGKSKIEQGKNKESQAFAKTNDQNIHGKIISVSYPKIQSGTIADLENKALEIKKKASQKAVEKTKPIEIRLISINISNEILNKVNKILKSQNTPLEIYNQGLTYETYCGTLFSILALQKYNKMYSELSKKLSNTTDQKMIKELQTQKESLNVSIIDYFTTLGMCKTDVEKLKSMALLLEKDKQMQSNIENLEKSIVNLEAVEPLPSAMVGYIDVINHNYMQMEEAMDQIFDLLINPCDLEPIPFTYTFQDEIYAEFKITGTAWCPSFSDLTRTCSVTIIGGHINVAWIIEINIVASCFGVQVSGCGKTSVCLTGTYSDIPTMPLVGYCGQCAGCVENVSTSFMIESTEGCSLFLTVEGYHQCNIPIFPLVAGNFTVNIQFNVPCGLSIGS